MIDFDEVSDDIYKLLYLLSEAHAWGKKNKWPIFQKYPQYKEIRVVGSNLNIKGGLPLMQHIIFATKRIKTSAHCLIIFGTMLATGCLKY